MNYFTPFKKPHSHTQNPFAYPLIIINHIRHDRHDDAPDDIVVHDAAIGGGQNASHLHHVRHCVRDDWFVLVQMNVRSKRCLQVFAPVQLWHFALQLRQC